VFNFFYFAAKFLCVQLKFGTILAIAKPVAYTGLFPGRGRKKLAVFIFKSDWNKLSLSVKNKNHVTLIYENLVPCSLLGLSCVSVALDSAEKIFERNVNVLVVDLHLALHC